VVRMTRSDMGISPFLGGDLRGRLTVFPVTNPTPAGQVHAVAIGSIRGTSPITTPVAFTPLRSVKATGVARIVRASAATGTKHCHYSP
jgi:hypothetical protein